MIVRGKRFEFSDTLWQLRANCDPMQVVFHDHKGQDDDVPFALQESPAIEDDLGKIGMGEHRQPGNDRVCHEVGIVIIAKAVT